MRQEIQSVILCGALTRLEQLPAPPSAKVLCQLAGLELPILAELRGVALAVAEQARSEGIIADATPEELRRRIEGRWWTSRYRRLRRRR